MAEYHVGCGIASIYAGTLNKRGDQWLHKSDVRNEALSAVAQFLMANKSEFRFMDYDGKKYRLCVEEIEESDNEAR